MNKKNVTLKIIILLLFTDILETALQSCFKGSALSVADLEVRNFGDIFIFLHGVFSSPFLWMGLGGVMVVFIIWSTVLSKIDLSVAVPIASFSYIFVPLSSIIFFHERISFLRWLGIFFILAGVVFVSKSSYEKEGSI